MHRQLAAQRMRGTILNLCIQLSSLREHVGNIQKILERPC